MNNDTIKALRERVQNDDLLTKEEQLEALRSLHRANRRIQAAKKAGYRELPQGAWVGPAAA
ncbi:hypothetical protein [Enterovirga rhinocerotis]|uniref:Transcriptional regulator n=1 Tax=Enterovirga rhinocerotis TaxID=1339210 RepID=A0A4R7BT58_9HYPH|nr:hypothetical protein [Enterovirga rhinocerotis]TDR88900.1 hypothetical protein EV668_3385 [Enterovirga rhinocerotis]